MAAGSGVVAGALVVGIFWALFGLVLERGVNASSEFRSMDKLDAMIRAQAVAAAGILTIAASMLIGLVMVLMEVFR